MKKRPPLVCQALYVIDQYLQQMRCAVATFLLLMIILICGITHSFGSLANNFTSPSRGVTHAGQNQANRLQHPVCAGACLLGFVTFIPYKIGDSQAETKKIFFLNKSEVDKNI